MQYADEMPVNYTMIQWKRLALAINAIVVEQ